LPNEKESLKELFPEGQLFYGGNDKFGDPFAALLLLLIVPVNHLENVYLATAFLAVVAAIHVQLLTSRQIVDKPHKHESSQILSPHSD
jgi:hypothetical protein